MRRNLNFRFDRYRNVGYLKQCIKRKGKCFVDVDVDLEEQEFFLFCNGEKLDDQRVLRDICKSDEDVIHLVVQKSAKVRATSMEKDLELSVVAAASASGESATKIPVGLDFWLEPVVLNPKIEFFPFLWDMINSTLEGLKKGKEGHTRCKMEEGRSMCQSLNQLMRKQ